MTYSNITILLAAQRGVRRRGERTGSHDSDGKGDADLLAPVLVDHNPRHHRRQRRVFGKDGHCGVVFILSTCLKRTAALHNKVAAPGSRPREMYAADVRVDLGPESSHLVSWRHTRGGSLALAAQDQRQRKAKEETLVAVPR